jgi:hypothetical protein
MEIPNFTISKEIETPLKPNLAKNESNSSNQNSTGSQTPEEVLEVDNAYPYVSKFHIDSLSPSA